MSSLKHELRQMYESGRSVNLFDGTEHLEEGLLERILNLSLLNPSVFPSQPWSVLAIKSSLSKQKLASLCKNDTALLHSAVCLIILKDSVPSSKEPVFPANDRQLLITSLMYACKFFAVDSHAIEFFDTDSIQKYFHVDSGFTIEMLAGLGYFGGAGPLLPGSAMKRYSQAVKEI